MLNIQKITVEYRENPVGIDEETPVISYVLDSDRNGSAQKSVRLTVSAGENVVWDTGTMQTEQTILHRYGGKRLKARTEYTVTVQAEDCFGERTEKTATFETGLFPKRGGVTTRFITHAFEEEIVCPVLGKRFSCAGKIKRARLYASALGMYDLHLNGKRVGDVYFTPYWTSYAHTLEYQTYDVTELLRGENTLEMTLADGWYKGDLTWKRKKNVYGDRLAGWAELYLEYENGAFEKIVTDESWHSSQSNVLFSSLYDGETIDCRPCAREQRSVRFYDHNTAILTAQINEPVRKKERLRVRKVSVSPRGQTILDFGQNLTGWVECDVCGKTGKKLTLRFAEVLDKYGNLYTENLRTAKATDTFLLKNGKNHCEPRFTFHGFRYCEVEGLDEIDPEWFEAVALYSDMERTGTFVCSDDDMNKLYSNQLWSNRGNYLDLPTDCPQRDERLGWTADAMIYCRTASTNFHTYLMFRKWLRDLACEQSDEYGVPHIVPNPLEKSDAAAAAWSDAAVFIPWILYQVYGDRRVLQEQYASMCGWVDYIARHAQSDGLWKSNFQFGDWLGLDQDEFSDRTGATDKYFIANAFYLQSLRIVCDTAFLLGKKGDGAKYTRLYKRVLKAVRAEYFTATGRMVTETQTAYVLALQFGIVPERLRDTVFAALAADVRARGHFMTGFLGTPFIAFVLTDYGRQDLTDLILRREKYPSWIYPIRNGATTMWERWNSRLENGEFNPGDMNSFNHCAYGAIAEWFYRRLVGIDALEAGYRKIKIKPVYSRGFDDYSRGTPTASDERRPVRLDGIDYVKGTVVCPYGAITCETDYENHILRAEIPVGATAEITLPDGAFYRVGSGKYEFSFGEIL